MMNYPTQSFTAISYTHSPISLDSMWTNSFESNHQEKEEDIEPFESEDLKSYWDYTDNLTIDYLSDYKEYIKKKRKDVLEQILSFVSLKNNWDGFGALPTGVKCAKAAISLLENLSDLAIIMMDDILPNTNGSISMEWKNSSKEKFALSIGANSFSFYFEENSIPHFFDKWSNNDIWKINSLDEMLDRFLQ